MNASINRIDLDALACRAGYTLTEDQAAALLAIYPSVAAMIARNRGERGRIGEPSHLFIVTSTAAQ